MKANTDISQVSYEKDLDELCHYTCFPIYSDSNSKYITHFCLGLSANIFKLEKLKLGFVNPFLGTYEKGVLFSEILNNPSSYSSQWSYHCLAILKIRSPLRCLKMFLRTEISGFESNLQNPVYFTSGIPA